MTLQGWKEEGEGVSIRTGAGGPGTVSGGAATSTGAVIRLQVRLTPAASVPGFYARVSGGRLDAPIEFSDKDAFVQFVAQIADNGPGLR